MSQHCRYGVHPVTEDATQSVQSAHLPGYHDKGELPVMKLCFHQIRPGNGACALSAQIRTVLNPA
jgi:hypothetical protein